MSDSLNLSTGALSGGLSPQRWSSKQRISRLARELAAGSSLDMRFQEGFFYRRNHTTDGADALFPAFDLMSTWTRTSAAWDPNWDFRNNSVVGRLEAYASGQVRYGDYGLLAEAAATNTIRNPRFEGATAGTLATTGVMPTHMSLTDHAGAEIIGVGISNGWPYVDVRVNGTPTQDLTLDLEVVSVIAASNAQTWTLSFGVEVIAGTFANFSGILPSISVRDGGGSAVQELYGSTVAPDADHRRRFQTSAISNGSAASVLPRLIISGNDGVTAVDFTLRFYAPQLELGAAPTSPVLPIVGTPATSTRNADTFVSGAKVTRASRGWYDDWSGVSGDPVGSLQEFRPNTPRIGPKGLLIEPARTNLVSNPRCAGGSGSMFGGGATPTNWDIYNIATYTMNHIEDGVENGWPYVDIQWLDNTTPGDGFFGEILLENRLTVGDGVTPLTGNTYVGSVCVEIVGGSLTNIRDIKLSVHEFNSGGVSVGSTEQIITPDILKRRFYVARTFANGGVHAGFSIMVRANGGGSNDLTLRISAPQFENAVFPTSPILNEVGAVAQTSRAVDDVSISAEPWVSDEPYSIYSRFTRRAGTGADYVLSLSDATGQDYAAAYNAGSTVEWFSAENGVIVESKSLGNFNAVGSETEFAVRQAANDFAGSMPSAVQTTDATWAVPVDPPTKLHLGSSPFASSVIHGYVEALRFFPPGKADADLETLVGNA